MPVLTVLGNGLLMLTGFTLITELWQRHCTALAPVFLWLAVALLALALLGNRFELHYVYSYSALALPHWLKFAGIWGGEQGTLLLLSAMLAVLAWRHRTVRSLTVGMQCLALAMSLGCLRFNAFASAL